MIVKFQSVIKREGAQDEVIKFTTPVTMGSRGDFTSWEFKEPAHGIMNLIEANNKVVNIFAGAQTIQLKLKDKIANSYQQPGMPMPIVFDSFLDELELNGSGLKVKYTLWQNKQIIGEYNMSLETN